MRAFIAAVVFGLSFGSLAAQSPIPCPGGREVSGFQLTVASSPNAAGPAVPLAEINNLGPGELLQYAPDDLPQPWRGSARVAVLLVPRVNSASAELSVFSERAARPATWKIPTQVGAVAFLFGPNGFNAKHTRALLTQHPELVAHFTAYATQASHVEALVALLSAYEQSPPGTLDLNTMLKQYSAEYGVKMPAANPALPPDQQAAILLAAVAPPTAADAPGAHAALTAGSTSTATALATLYFGPVMGIASDTMPLLRALHQTLLPGTQFQGAFAQRDGGAMRLCMANTAAPPGKHTVYLWMVNLPGGAVPVVRLAKATSAILPAGRKTDLAVTCATVAQLRDLQRARQWELQPSSGAAIPVPVAFSAGPVDDTLTLDLAAAQAPPGDYRLRALWDWSPVQVQGALAVRDVASLAGAALDPGPPLVSGAAPQELTFTGADFSFVQAVALLSPGATQPEKFQASPTQLSLTLDPSHLPAGAYKLRLTQVNGAARELPLTVLPPNPTLLPLRVNLASGPQPLTLRGQHLDRILSIASDGAQWMLAPPSSTDPTARQATLTLAPGAAPGQVLSASLTVPGESQPIVVPQAVQILGPRPAIENVHSSVNTGGTVELLSGELPADATVNFSFSLEHAPALPLFRLGCRSADAPALTLHPGESFGTQELETEGNGLYYLAAVPGKLGPPGCQLRLSVSDPARGDSVPYDLGRIVQLPKIASFTLTSQSPGPNLYDGQLTGDNLQLIAKTGWSPDLGVAVSSIPEREPAGAQTLAIVMPWPPPAPHAPLYIWLHGETQGRKTTVRP